MVRLFRVSGFGWQAAIVVHVVLLVVFATHSPNRQAAEGLHSEPYLAASFCPEPETELSQFQLVQQAEPGIGDQDFATAGSPPKFKLALEIERPVVRPGEQFLVKVRLTNLGAGPEIIVWAWRPYSERTLIVERRKLPKDDQLSPTDWHDAGPRSFCAEGRGIWPHDFVNLPPQETKEVAVRTSWGNRMHRVSANQQPEEYEFRARYVRLDGPPKRHVQGNALELWEQTRVAEVVSASVKVRVGTWSPIAVETLAERIQAMDYQAIWVASLMQHPRLLPAVELAMNAATAESQSNFVSLACNYLELQRFDDVGPIVFRTAVATGTPPFASSASRIRSRALSVLKNSDPDVVGQFLIEQLRSSDDPVHFQAAHEVLQHIGFRTSNSETLALLRRTTKDSTYDYRFGARSR